MKKTIVKRTGISRIAYAGYYSFKALKHNVLHESAFRQEVIASSLLIPLALYLNVTDIEQVLMICSLFIVMIVELLNTAIEAAVDRIGLEYHELSGLAKDSGSAAVFISLLLAAFIWAHSLFF